MHGDFFVFQESFTEYELTRHTLTSVDVGRRDRASLQDCVNSALSRVYSTGGENPVAFSLSHTIQLSNIQCAIEP